MAKSWYLLVPVRITVRLASPTLYALFPFSRHEIIVPKPLKRGFVSAPQGIGNHLYTQRVRLRMSRPKLATLFEVNPNTILKWEKGIDQPSVEHKAKICEFLGYEVKGETSN